MLSLGGRDHVPLTQPAEATHLPLRYSSASTSAATEKLGISIDNLSANRRNAFHQGLLFR